MIFLFFFLNLILVNCQKLVIFCVRVRVVSDKVFFSKQSHQSNMNGCWQALKRRKQIDHSDGNTQLARVLNLFDLTALGVGSTLGLGAYVLAGSVAYNEAGPAVTISFLIAALASGISAICYAEFASRVPKAGSAYVYTYISVGEFLAYTIGWNLILEYIIGKKHVSFRSHVVSLEDERKPLVFENPLLIRNDDLFWFEFILFHLFRINLSKILYFFLDKMTKYEISRIWTLLYMGSRVVYISQTFFWD